MILLLFLWWEKDQSQKQFVCCWLMRNIVLSAGVWSTPEGSCTDPIRFFYWLLISTNFHVLAFDILMSKLTWTCTGVSTCLRLYVCSYGLDVYLLKTSNKLPFILPNNYHLYCLVCLCWYCIRVYIYIWSKH